MGRRYRNLDCWYERCPKESSEDCTIISEEQLPDGINRPTVEGEREVLPVPPNTPGRDGGLTGRTPSQGEVLRTPPETTIQGETGIADRPVEQGEVLPTPPPTTQQDGGITKGTGPLLQPPLDIEEGDRGQTEPETTPEPEECGEGETFNEQTGQCEPIGELEQTEPVEQQSSEE